MGPMAQKSLHANYAQLHSSSLATKTLDCWKKNLKITLLFKPSSSSILRTSLEHQVNFTGEYDIPQGFRHPPGILASPGDSGIPRDFLYPQGILGIPRGFWHPPGNMQLAIVTTLVLTLNLSCVDLWIAGNPFQVLFRKTLEQVLTPFPAFSFVVLSASQPTFHHHHLS